MTADFGESSMIEDGDSCRNVRAVPLRMYLTPEGNFNKIDADTPYILTLEQKCKNMNIRKATVADKEHISRLHIESTRKLCADHYTHEQLNAWTAIKP